MEPYKDDPTSPETRRTTRQREIQNMEAAAAGASLPGGGGASAGTGGRTRAFVARRFLEDEDLENVDSTRRVGGLDLVDEDETLAIPVGSIRSTGGASVNLFQRHEQFQVDQSVNLMDASAATYDTRKKKRNMGIGGNLMDSSMVDVFFDDNSARWGDRRGGSDRRGQRTCRDLVCSTRFLIFITCLIVGLLLVVFSLGGAKGMGIGGSTASDEDSLPDQPKETPAPIIPNGLHPDRVELLRNKIRKYTSEEDLDNPATHAHSAFHWLVEDDPVQLVSDDPGLLQRYALAVLYFSTQPANEDDAAFSSWIKKENWMTEKDVCTWYGIDCEKIYGYNSVVHLNMTANRLAGSLPSELKALHNLRELDLSHNRLGSSIPDAIGEMSNLEYLILEDNSLTSHLPTTLGKMTNIKEIVLSKNKIDGLLPEGLETLDTLQALYISDNLLTGPIPNHWKLPNVHTLDFSNNEFVGHLPHTSFQLMSLHTFKLGNNFLTGTVPPELVSFDNLEVFEVGMNRLHGTIPEIFDELLKLKEVDFRRNDFQGKLPTTLGRARALKKLLLDANELTGTIPVGWGGMTNLESIALHHNKLTGELPTTIGELVSLKEFHLNDNEFSGKLPREMGSMEMLANVHLENNRLTGALPTELGLLHRLQTMRLHTNALTGEMPPGICDLHGREMEFLAADCGEVACDCCDKCY